MGNKIWRGFFIGVIVSICIGYLDPYLSIHQGISLSNGYITPWAYLFLLVVILLTGLFSFINKRFLLSYQELYLLLGLDMRIEKEEIISGLCWNG